MQSHGLKLIRSHFISAGIDELLGIEQRGRQTVQPFESHARGNCESRPEGDDPFAQFIVVPAVSLGLFPSIEQRVMEIEPQTRLLFFRALSVVTRGARAGRTFDSKK